MARKSKTIEDYLKPQQPVKNVFVQIDETLFMQIKKHLEEDGISMRQLVEASLTRYIDEKRDRKGSK